MQTKALRRQQLNPAGGYCAGWGSTGCTCLVMGLNGLLSSSRVMAIAVTPPSRPPCFAWPSSTVSLLLNSGQLRICKSNRTCTCSADSKLCTFTCQNFCVLLHGLPACNQRHLRKAGGALCSAVGQRRCGASSPPRHAALPPAPSCPCL